MESPIWQTQFGNSPLVATAIHDGHMVRDELTGLLAISEDERLREEDPFTGMWTSVASTRIVGLRSRFEVDLNRPREKAVYQSSEDSWGLQVWREPLPKEIVLRSLAEWDAFYRHIHDLLTHLTKQYSRVVLLDIHSYNHRRDGPDAEEADADGNPEVNIGTRSMNRERWAPILDQFISDFRQFDYNGRHLDVRENVKFFGGHFPTWIHQTFPENVCAIAVEFKKVFMDEWSGHPDQDQLFAIGQALQFAAGGVSKEIGDRA